MLNKQVLPALMLSVMLMAQTKASGIPEVMQPDFSNGLFSGFIETDFNEIKRQFSLPTNAISEYSELHQAYYWYHLAQVNYELRLSSDDVLPYLDKALNLKSHLSEQQQVAMLFKAQQLKRTYGHYQQAIAHLQQIEKIFPPQHFAEFNVDIAELYAAYGAIYFASGDHQLASDYFSSIIKETEKRSITPKEQWLYKLSMCQTSLQDHSAAMETINKLHLLYPSRKNEVRWKRQMAWLKELNDN